MFHKFIILFTTSCLHGVKSKEPITTKFYNIYAIVCIGEDEHSLHISLKLCINSQQYTDIVECFFNPALISLRNLSNDNPFFNMEKMRLLTVYLFVVHL